MYACYAHCNAGGAINAASLQLPDHSNFSSTFSAMERKIATAVNCLFEDDFDLFGGSDCPALMNLTEEYFCGEDPDGMSSGIRNSSD